MHPKTQNQNTNQGYEFILEQHPTEPPKNGTNKKIIVIIALLIITLICIGILLLTASNSAQQESQSAQSAQVNEQAAQDVISAFYGAAAAGDAKALRSTFVDDLPYDESYFSTNIVPFLKKVDVSKCQAVENREGVGLVDERGFVIQTYECPIKDSENFIGMEFALRSTDSGGFEIFYYNLVALDEATE